MKCFAIILTLIIVTPTITYAGELDGNGLICDNVRKPDGSNSHFTFYSDKVIYWSLGSVSPFKPGGNEWSEYTMLADKIIWDLADVGKFVWAKQFHSLNRETLVLTINPGNGKYQCTVKTTHQILDSINLRWEKLKAKMKKKNKI